VDIPFEMMNIGVYLFIFILYLFWILFIYYIFILSSLLGMR
jgi:hypothetical protein